MPLLPLNALLELQMEEEDILKIMEEVAYHHKIFKETGNIKSWFLGEAVHLGQLIGGRIPEIA